MKVESREWNKNRQTEKNNLYISGINIRKWSCLKKWMWEMQKLLNNLKEEKMDGKKTE